ncbi:hypothetical protein HID58_021426 [Brassica napus]|uniref:Uncharacterized protein n=1 Tax=Brassica napus TaxID=3708 RepID=A0ABQ8CWK4_BRANA|nr:hypothetical protein HID58_021426 [Brassica napus]
MAGDKNEKSSVNFVSNAKHVDGYDAMKKAQVQRRSGEEFSKETTKMKMNPKKPIEKETGVEEEDDLVAYTADYWKPRHHPPKNN